MSDTRVGTMPEDENLATVAKEIEAENAAAEEVASDDEDGSAGDESWDTRSMDPDEEVWPDGPTVGEVNAWKDQYGRVYMTDFMGEMVAWRTLTRFEFRRVNGTVEQQVAAGTITQNAANLDVEDSIAEICILYPRYSRAEGSKSMAGIATTISEQVMQASGFTATDVREL